MLCESSALARYKVLGLPLQILRLTDFILNITNKACGIPQAFVSDEIGAQY